MATLERLCAVAYLAETSAEGPVVYEPKCEQVRRGGRKKSPLTKRSQRNRWCFRPLQLSNAQSWREGAT
jgi:hypothetical protein